MAEQLGYTCCDTLLLEKMAQHGGISQSVLKRYDERLADKWRNLTLYNGAEETDQLPVSVRAAYDAYHIDKQWGTSESYHLCVDSGLFGIDGAVSVLQNCLQMMPK